jgi:hypothetical protein
MNAVNLYHLFIKKFGKLGNGNFSLLLLFYIIADLRLIMLPKVEKLKWWLKISFVFAPFINKSNHTQKNYKSQ